jgi:hypothetical protein
MPTSIDHTVDVAQMNNLLPSGPPNVQLATTSGVGMRPISAASGARMWMPSPADVQTLPSTSTRNPSDTPG